MDVDDQVEETELLRLERLHQEQKKARFEKTEQLKRIKKELEDFRQKNPVATTAEKRVFATAHGVDVTQVNGYFQYEKQKASLLEVLL